ncbi:serine hydrolase domain-containing protein [Dongia rigui]|uniref:Serine hydrolase n=1 Tax=Dongia rigui TaxID=940149 RepID=A0ABU5DYZ4_9PROT|nr:serine hydrolase [Dongia rigui]MDY0871771.1 serine hydrolase [Dongia rigui]
MTTAAPHSPRIPRADWDRPPHNRWAFHHIREILPTAEVWRGSGPVSALPRRPFRLDDVRFQAARGELTIRQFLDDSFTDGFIVLKDGAIVFERYMNGMTERSAHLSQSVAKSLTGALIGILSHRGALDPNGLVTDYLPELKATGYDGATLQQILDMSSGVAYDETYTDPFSDVGQTDVASGWKPKPAGDTRAWPRSIWQQILGLKQCNAEHGARFNYRSIETDVLAFVAERVTGQRLPQLISAEIWQKLGCEENSYYTVDAEGYALADGGFNATLRDYARFGLMIAQDGVIDGRQVVPAAWIAETRRGDPDQFDADYRATMPFGAYRNQFWLPDYRGRATNCLGVFGQWIHADPDTGIVIVKLSSWPDFLDDARFVEQEAACAAVKRALVHA